MFISIIVKGISNNKLIPREYETGISNTAMQIFFMNKGNEIILNMMHDFI
jgi:hypothetical protein